MQKVPQLFLYKQDKKSCLGAITHCTEFSEDIRFNACSELSFKIPKHCYDTENECWVRNPIYNSVEKHKLLFLADDTEYFEYPIRQIGDSTFYRYKTNDERGVYSRTRDYLTCYQNNSLINIIV